jgi:hypothetical protein
MSIPKEGTASTFCAWKDVRALGDGMGEFPNRSGGVGLSASTWYVGAWRAEWAAGASGGSAGGCNHTTVDGREYSAEEVERDRPFEGGARV